MFAVIVFAYGCSSNSETTPSAKRTVLIYIAANNDLSGYAHSNITDMIYGAADCNLKNDNLIVYFAVPNENPKLYRIDKNGKELVKSYPVQNSLQPDVMANVLTDVREAYPAPSNGVIFWSHGYGWMEKKIYSTRSTGDSEEGSPHPMTKNFGVDNLATGGISAETIASLLPDNAYDFIGFDACLMGAIEVVWPLRDKCKYFLGSVAEILADGLPYRKIISHLFEENEVYLDSIASKYYQTYRFQKQSAYDRSATIAVVDCQQLEPLAAELKRLANKYSDTTIDLNKVQWFDRVSYGNHFAFDLGDFVDNLCGDMTEKQTFYELLDKAIPAKYSTPTLWKGDWRGRDITVKKHSGLSIFIPMTNEPAATMEAYQKTDWYKYFYQN